MLQALLTMTQLERLLIENDVVVINGMTVLATYVHRGETYGFAIGKDGIPFRIAQNDEGVFEAIEMEAQ